MARCGCGSACACVVQAGDGTTVTGNGSPTNPYVVSAESALVANDSNTVDHTLTGTGSAADPYMLSSTVILVPGDNGVEATPAGLLVEPSGDVGNTMIFGTDGKLFAPATAVTVADSDCINSEITGSGTTADPYVITVDPIIAADPNGLDCGPGGLAVVPSTDAGNGLGFGTDGNLMVTAGAATVSSDCGVLGDGSPGDPVRANTPAAWPFVCDITAEGDDVYCDPATGQLKVAPPHEFVTMTIDAGATQVDNAPACAGVVFVEVDRSAPLVITNPSNCRDMQFEIQISGRSRIDVDVAVYDPAGVPGGSATYNSASGISINGAPTLQSRNDTFNRQGNRISVVGHESDVLIPTVVVGPGGALTVEGVISYSCDAPALGITRVVYNLPGIKIIGRTI